MKVLVIPDVHLKPEIFDRAMSIMENSDCECAVCVGDICDDWGCEWNVELYKKTLQKIARFAKDKLQIALPMTLHISGICMIIRDSPKMHRMLSASISESWMTQVIWRSCTA